VIKWKILMVSVVLCLAACQTVNTQTPAVTSTATLVVPNQLSLSEYPLENLPEPESAELQTVLDAIRQDSRFKFDKGEAGVVLIPFCEVGGIQGICGTLGLDDLFAFEQWDRDGSGRVIVDRNGSEIYTIPVGAASPLTNLHELWTYDDHWVMEIVRVNIEQDGNQSTFETIGQIIQDGELLNDRYGYDEAYEFQFLYGRPFFLFRRGTSIDANYNGAEVPLGYSQVIHYGCCSESTLNLVHYEDHLDFFARKGEGWYYVEIGTFK
jgi:hypothetical protein